MSEKKPILSISLLASNRKDTTKKCLDSLKMIMDQISCELVIVDTGCDEEMQELLHEYTDHIIPFTWCNDFSKARNAGLKECSGEWFLYIDDDEWFDNVDEIVEFFQSGEYRNYTQANYLQRNYSDLEGKRYLDCWVSRMIQLREETSFQSSIHEYMVPVGNYTKLLHSYVNHYGYIFHSDEEKYRHSKRNISLLLEMLQTERGNIRWWAQLAQEYFGIHEYGKLIDLCNDALKLIENIDQPFVNAERGLFYSGILRAELATFRLEEAKEHYEAAMKDQRNTDVCRAMLLSQGTEINFRLKNYDEAKACASGYAQLHEQWMSKEDVDERMLAEGAFFTREAFTLDTQIPVYSCLISLCLKEKDTSALKKYFDKLGWEEELLKTSTLICKDLIEAFSELDYDEAFPEMAQTMINRKELTDSVIADLKRIEKDGGETYDRLLTIFSKVESSHYYVWYMKVHYADRKNNMALLTESMTRLLNCVNDMFHLDHSVWEIAERNGLNLDQIFVQIPFDQWKNGVDCFCEKTTLEELKEIRIVVEKSRQTRNIRYDYFDVKAKEAVLVYGESRDQYEPLRRLMSDFCDSSIRFYGNIYQAMTFQGDMEFLPSSCRLAVQLKNVLESQEQMKAKDVVCALEQCLGVFPSLDAVVRAYIQLFGEKEEARLNQLLKQQPLNQIAELLSAVSDAIEYLKSSSDAELEAAVWQHRENIERLIDQQIGCSVRERIDSGNLSNEDWLLEMYRVLDELEHPFSIVNRMDYEFVELIEDIWKTTRDQLVGRMKHSLLKLKDASEQTYHGFVQYYSRFPLWGSFDPENDDWQTLELRAQTLKQRSYEFLWLYKRLEDALSKRTLFAILKNWAVLDIAEIRAVKSIFPDYYEPDIFPDNKCDVFVDVGAYIGDSIQSYISMYGSGYRKIYAFEISDDSVEQLKKNTENFHDVTVIQKGAGDKFSVMYMNENTASSSANRAGSNENDETGTAVEIVAIDEELEDVPTFIKMDIEGAEQGALLGCQKIIAQHHPKLAICTYHGYEDIWKVPFMIDCINPNYKFYMRHYGGDLIPTEFVLLCKPESINECD